MFRSLAKRLKSHAIPRRNKALKKVGGLARPEDPPNLSGFKRPESVSRFKVANKKWCASIFGERHRELISGFGAHGVGALKDSRAKRRASAQKT